MSACRIAVVTNIPTPYRTAFFDAVARACAERGFAVRVFYCAAREHDRNWTYDPAAMRHPHEILPGLHLRRGADTFHLNPSILRRLRAFRPDVVLSAGSWHMPATVLSSLGPRRHASVFWSEGHADAVLHGGGPIARLRGWMLGRHDAFATPNNRSDAWVQAQVRGAARTIRLPNTVQGSDFERRDPDERARARRELGLPEDGRLIVQVSQLTVRKGVVPLAEAFLRLPSGARDVRLALVGSGPLQPDLARLAAASDGRIVLAGSLQAAGVRRWLMAADWFVLNTLRDPNPLAPIEASFAALPLLLTGRAGNAGELLREGETGFIIADPADPGPALARALACTPEETARMGAAAHANAAAQFDIARVAADLVTDLSALADERRGGAGRRGTGARTR